MLTFGTRSCILGLEPDVAPDGAAPGSSSFPTTGGGLLMLVYIDESGHPRPNDSTKNPVIAAVCIKEPDSGRLSRAMCSLRRRLLAPLTLNKGEEEGKAVHFLSRRALTYSPVK